MRKFLARFRQAPMFSSVYILGAALSVASVMLVAIFLHVKTSNIYPEYSRDRLLYMSYAHSELDAGSVTGKHGKTTSTSSLGIGSINLLNDSLRREATTGFMTYPFNLAVYLDDKRFEGTNVRYADSSIFDIYDYKIIEGKPFTAQDIESNAMKVMISDRLARKVFGTDHNVVGREIIVDASVRGYFLDNSNGEMRLSVCAVFEEGSRLLPQSFTEVIVPVHQKTLNYEILKPKAMTGPFILVIKPNEGVSDAHISEIVRSQLNRFLSVPFDSGEDWKSYSTVRSDDGTFKFEVTESFHMTYPVGGFILEYGNWPRTSAHVELGDSYNPDDKFDAKDVTKLYGLLILVLLLVPALNLSSLISGNMDSKLSEMGIRKAFGASNSTLLRQVLNENLWLTGCGAMLGVILSWIGVLLWKEWLFAGTGVTGAQLSASDVFLDPAMLFAPKVFIIAVAVCFVLNLLSSLIPAWWALHRPAIDAIKAKS